jgi:hypothetical protein
MTKPGPVHVPLVALHPARHTLPCISVRVARMPIIARDHVKEKIGLRITRTVVLPRSLARGVHLRRKGVIGISTRGTNGAEVLRSDGT